MIKCQWIGHVFTFETETSQSWQKAECGKAPRKTANESLLKDSETSKILLWYLESGRLGEQ